MVESEWSIIVFSKYFKIQFAWPTFQKRSWTVMTIMSTNNRKDKNAWGIPSIETYLTSIRKKNISKKDLFYLHGIYSIQTLCLCTLWLYGMTSLVSCCARIVNQNKWPTLLHDRADVTTRYIIFFYKKSMNMPKG